MEPNLELWRKDMEYRVVINSLFGYFGGYQYTEVNLAPKVTKANWFEIQNAAQHIKTIACSGKIVGVFNK